VAFTKERRAREHLKTDAARAEVVDDVDEMAQVAAQSVEFPDDQGVPPTQGLQGSVEPPTGGEAAGGAVLIEQARGHTGGPQGVALQIHSARAGTGWWTKYGVIGNLTCSLGRVVGKPSKWSVKLPRNRVAVFLEPGLKLSG